MSYRNIEINRLQINRANDRHGELENETAAIAWLFRSKEKHMRSLARDIVSEGRVYEPPLISENNGMFTVFDGNRRVTCLKLLQNPERAPTLELQDFFRKLRSSWKGNFPETINCQIEEDKDQIDNILYRRHTGTLNGVGQSNWDDRMKDNFVARSGKTVGYNIADEIERRLKEKNLLPEKKIPRSNLNRFLSAEIIRNKVGFSVKKKEFNYTHNPEIVLKALQKIANDFSYGIIVLGDIWDNSGKLKYLDKLYNQQYLPKEEDRLNQVSKEIAPKHSPRPTKPKPPAQVSRDTLIPHKEFGILWTGEQQRLHSIWNELQFELKTEKHPNAVSVLFRVLLELSIEFYAKHNEIVFNQNEKLSKKVEKIGVFLHQNEKIDQKQYSATKKFGQLDQLVSADTLNRYVHSPNFAPSAKHLEALWDTMADFIVACLKG